MAKAPDWDDNIKKRRKGRSVHIRGYGMIYGVGGFGWAPSGQTAQNPNDTTPDEVPGEGMPGGAPLSAGQFEGFDGGGEGGGT